MDNKDNEPIKKINPYKTQADFIAAATKESTFSKYLHSIITGIISGIIVAVAMLFIQPELTKDGSNVNVGKNTTDTTDKIPDSSFKK